MQSRAPLHSLFVSLFVVVILALAPVLQAAPDGVTKIKDISDINQKLDPAWGPNWCGPTSIANSMVYLRKKYGLDALTQNNGTDMTEKQLVEAIASAMGMQPGGAGISYNDLVVRKPNYWQPRVPWLIQSQKTSDVEWTNNAGDWTLRKNDSSALLQFIKDESAKCEDIEIGYSKVRYGADGKWHFAPGGHWQNVPMRGLEESDVHMVTLAGYGEPFFDANENNLLDPEELSSYTDIFPNGVYDSDVLINHDPGLDFGTTHDEFFPGLGVRPVTTAYYKLGLINLADFGGEGFTHYVQGYNGSLTGDVIDGSSARAPQVGDVAWLITGAVTESVPEPAFVACLAPAVLAMVGARRRRA